MAQTIQIYRTNSNTPPTTLLSGVLSAELGAQTKLWIGSGSGNRLLLSSDPADTAAAGGAYLKLAGGTLTGPLLLAADPGVNLGAATKQYVDTKTTAITGSLANYLPLAGGTLTGALTLAADPSAALGAATKQYVDAKPGGAQIGPAPPVGPAGTLWWDSNGGQLYVYYNDGNTTQWVPASSVPGIGYPITVAQGGTGATTPPQALANLGIVYPTSIAQGGTGAVTAPAALTALGAAPATTGQLIRANLGAGTMPNGTWTALGWTTSINDTGVAPVGNTWTPPAGRWIVTFNVQFTAGTGTNAIGLGLGFNGTISNSQGVGYQTAVGASLAMSLTEITDFSGTTVLSLMGFSNAGVTGVTAQSWWAATRIR